MHDISAIDQNFKIETNINKSDIRFFDIKNEPFKVCGVAYENGKYRRMPEAVAKNISGGVYALHTNTAGGRVRFKTNSPYISINAKMDNVGKMGHFTLAGSAGYDLYIKENGKEHYAKSFIPYLNISCGYEGVAEFGNTEMREITINFPLYSDVLELYVGISENAQLLSVEPYTIEKPIVFYGSSITQGGCASRPGNAYTAAVARRFDADHINFGFSGNALAEIEMTEYIKSIPMSAFVFDYDHNAPTLEYLESTHFRMFDTIRKANPDLPIIILSRPKYNACSYEEKCRDIIYLTFERAKAAGDNNVYFLDGKQLMAMAGYEGTVDDCHPNDLGFASMAKAIGDIMECVF